MHTNICEAIEQSSSISLNGVMANLIEYSYFAEPQKSREEVQLKIFDTKFTFNQMNKATFDREANSWCVGEHKLQLTF